MSETHLSEFEVKPYSDRTMLHVLYGLHTLAWFSGGVFAIIALIINYVKRANEKDALSLSHHNYMIATFWWTLFWLVVLSPLWLLFVLPGIAAYFIIWLWYLYRCVRGWMRLNAHQLARGPVF